MKKVQNLTAMLMSVFLASTLYAEPAFKSTTLKSAYMKYNSEVLVIEFESPLNGGCNESTIAVSNAGAANNNEMISFALAALMAGKPVEVAFGGGCHNGNNWLQTIRVSK